MSRGTRDTQPLPLTFTYGSITLYGTAFQHASVSLQELMLSPTTPGLAQKSHSGFGLFPVRSPLLRKSTFLSFPSGTEMVHFPEFTSTPYKFRSR